MRSIKEWQKYIHEWARGKGWYEGYDPVGGEDPRNLYEMIALCHSELSEAVEELRNTVAELGEMYMHEGNNKPCGFPVELADTVIRILDIAEYCDIDLEEMMKVKMKFNEGREHRHGGKRA